MKKKWLSHIYEIIIMLLNCLMGAFCFIKIDHDVAVLPDSEGGTVQIDYWYSIYDKLLRENLQILVYLALAVMVASVLLSVFTLIAKDNRKLKIANYAVFAVSALFFLVLFFYAACIQYCY